MMGSHSLGHRDLLVTLEALSSQVKFLEEQLPRVPARDRGGRLQQLVDLTTQVEFLKQ
jgi:hypothetical protein